jgi:hypothetical protein
MRKLVLLPTMIAAVAFVAFSASGTSAASQSGGRTLTFGERETPGGFAQIDNPPHGKQPTIGDETVFVDDLVNTAGRVVGTDHGVCTVTVPRRAQGQCAVTYLLADGSITAQGIGLFRGRAFSIAVVGGTGAYEGVRGSATVTLGTHEKVTIHLLP